MAAADEIVAAGNRAARSAACAGIGGVASTSCSQRIAGTSVVTDSVG